MGMGMGYEKEEKQRNLIRKYPLDPFLSRKITDEDPNSRARGRCWPSIRTRVGSGTGRQLPVQRAATSGHDSTRRGAGRGFGRPGFSTARARGCR